MTSAFILAQGGAAPLEHTELPIAPIWYGIIAFATFLVLLALLWSFRNTLNVEQPAQPGQRPGPDTTERGTGR